MSVFWGRKWSAAYLGMEKRLAILVSAILMLAAIIRRTGSRSPAGLLAVDPVPVDIEGELHQLVLHFNA